MSSTRSRRSRKRRTPPVAVEVSPLPESATRDRRLDGWSTNTSDGLLRGSCAWLNEDGPWVLSGVSRLASDGPGSADLVPRRATCALKAALGTPTKSLMDALGQAR